MKRDGNVVSGICLACGQYFKKYATRGRFQLQACDNRVCAERARMIAEKNRGKRRNDCALKVYEVANARYRELHFRDRMRLFARLYDELKTGCQDIKPSFRNALTCQKINAIHRTEHGEIVPGLAQAFYAFCLKYRGVTPMQLLKKRKTKKEEQVIGEAEKKAISDGYYNAGSISEEGSAVSWLLGDDAAFEAFTHLRFDEHEADVPEVGQRPSDDKLLREHVLEGQGDEVARSAAESVFPTDVTATEDFCRRKAAKKLQRQMKAIQIEKESGTYVAPVIERASESPFRFDDT